MVGKSLTKSNATPGGHGCTFSCDRLNEYSLPCSKVIKVKTTEYCFFFTAGWSDNLMFMKTQLQIKKAAKGAASATVVSLLCF